MKKIIAGAFIMLCCISCKHEGNILLRLKYNPSEKIDVRYRTYTLTDKETDAPLINEMIRFGITVNSITADSSYNLSVKIDYIRAQNGGMLRDEYASDQDESEMGTLEKSVHARMKPIIDSVYKLTINNRGEILKPITYANGAPIAKIPIIYTNYQPVFPKQKIAIGDEWADTTTLATKGIKRYCSYHIESIYNAIIQIKVSGTMERNNGDRQDFSGRYMIDQKTQELISAKIEIPVSEYPKKLKMIIDIQSH